MMIIFGLKIILTNFELFLVISNSMPEDKQNGFRNIFDAVLNAFIVIGNQSCYLFNARAIEAEKYLKTIKYYVFVTF